MSSHFMPPGGSMGPTDILFLLFSEKSQNSVVILKQENKYIQILILLNLAIYFLWQPRYTLGETSLFKVSKLAHYYADQNLKNFCVVS